MKKVKIKLTVAAPNTWYSTVVVGAEIIVTKYTMEDDGPLLKDVWDKNYKDFNQPFPDGFPPVIYSYEGPTIIPAYQEKNKSMKYTNYHITDSGWIFAEHAQELMEIKEFMLIKKKPVTTTLSTQASLFSPSSLKSLLILALLFCAGCHTVHQYGKLPRRHPVQWVVVKYTDNVVDTLMTDTRYPVGKPAIYVRECSCDATVLNYIKSDK